MLHLIRLNVGRHHGHFARRPTAQTRLPHLLASFGLFWWRWATLRDRKKKQTTTKKHIQSQAFSDDPSTQKQVAAFPLLHQDTLNRQRPRLPVCPNRGASWCFRMAYNGLTSKSLSSTNAWLETDGTKNDTHKKRKHPPKGFLKSTAVIWNKQKDHLGERWWCWAVLLFAVSALCAIFRWPPIGFCHVDQQRDVFNMELQSSGICLCKTSIFLLFSVNL